MAKKFDFAPIIAWNIEIYDVSAGGGWQPLSDGDGDGSRHRT